MNPSVILKLEPRMSKGADWKRVEREVCTRHGGLVIPLIYFTDHRWCSRNEGDTKEYRFIRES